MNMKKKQWYAMVIIHEELIHSSYKVSPKKLLLDLDYLFFAKRMLDIWWNIMLYSKIDICQSF